MVYADILNNNKAIQNEKIRFNDRILMLLEQQRKSKSWLANQIGVSKQAINYLLNCATSPKYINEIAIALEVRPEWLLFGTGKMYSSSESEDIKRIPILSLKDIPSFLNNEFQSITSDFTHLTTSFTSTCFATILENSSMEPLFFSGTLLIFNTEIKPNNGDYILFSPTNEKDIYFRQYFIDGIEIYLKASNSIFKVFKKNKIIILGVLIESRTHFK